MTRRHRECVRKVVFGLCLSAAAGCDPGTAPRALIADERSQTTTSVIQRPPLFSDENQLPVYEFTVSNATRQDVTIKKVLASCRCVRSSINRLRLRSGESATVTAQMNLRGFSGHRSDEFLILSEAGPIAKYLVHYNVYQAVEVVGDSLIDCGIVAPESTMCHQVHIRRASRADTELPAVVSTTIENCESNGSIACGNWMHAGTEQQDRDGIQQEVLPVNLCIGAGTTVGPGSAELVIKYIAANAPVPRSLRIPINWTIKSEFQLAPRRIVINSRPSLDATKSVQITTCSGRPIKVPTVAKVLPGVDCSVVSVNESTVELVLRFYQNGIPALTRGEVVLETGEAVEPLIHIPIVYFDPARM